MDYAAFYEQHLGKIKWGPKGEGMARCPFHEDKTASLAVNRARGLWFCHACNEGGSARDFAKRRGVDPPQRRDEEAVAAYVYHDAKGRPTMRVVRTLPKGFYQERYEGGGRFVPGVKDVALVLYRLPEVLAATAAVLVVEGEKDVEALRAWGFVATTNPMGAGKWRREYSEALRGKAVWLIPDKDDAGHRHMDRVGRSLRGVAASVKLLELAGLPEGGDVSDWKAQGHRVEELKALIAGAPEWSPARERPAALEGLTLGEVCPGRMPPDMQGIRLPAGYTVRDGRLYEGEETLITPTPILPARVLEDLDTGDVSYEVLLLAAGSAKRFPVGAQDIRDVKRVITLTRRGLDMDSTKSRELVKFISGYLHVNRLERIRQTHRLGWVSWDGGAAYVLHENHPEGAPVHFAPDNEESRQLQEALRPHGTLDGVKALVSAIAMYPTVVTTLCASLAPVAREILHLEAKNFWLHLSAPSSTGKTLTQRVALSAWAEPIQSAWLAHGHATYAGMEKLCERTFGLPVFAEDAHNIRDKDRPDLIYAVGNEAFKARGGDRPRPQIPWRGAVITSGELGLLDETSLEGVGARLITLGAPPFGPFSVETRRFLEERLSPLLREHHGLLGPTVLTRLLHAGDQEHRRLVAWWAGCRDKFTAEAAGNKIAARQAATWALLGLIGRLITETLGLQLMPALEDQVWEAFGEALRTPPPDPVRAAYEYVLSYAQSNRAFFYVRTAEGTTDPREAGSGPSLPGIGEKDIPAERGRPVQGLINEREGSVAFYTNILRDVLARAKLGGAERFLRAWRDRDWLIATGTDLTHNVKIARRVERLYVLKNPEAEESTPDAP